MQEKEIAYAIQAFDSIHVCGLSFNLKGHFLFSSLHLTLMHTWEVNRIQIGFFKGEACILSIKNL